MIYLPRAILFTFVYIPGGYIEGRVGDLRRGLFIFWIKGLSKGEAGWCASSPVYTLSFIISEFLSCGAKLIFTHRLHVLPCIVLHFHLEQFPHVEIEHVMLHRVPVWKH